MTKVRGILYKYKYSILLLSFIKSIPSPFPHSSHSMASMSSLKMISSLKLSHSSSTSPLPTQNQLVSSNLSQSFQTKKFNSSSITRTSSKNTTTTALLFNNQKEHQQSSKPGRSLLNSTFYF